MKTLIIILYVIIVVVIINLLNWLVRKSFDLAPLWLIAIMTGGLIIAIFTEALINWEILTITLK